MKKAKKIFKRSEEICSALGGLKVDKEKPPHWPLGCSDGQEWAKEFCLITGFKDEALMISWFANALITGYDERRREESLKWKQSMI